MPNPCEKSSLDEVVRLERAGFVVMKQSAKYDAHFARVWDAARPSLIWAIRALEPK